MIDQTLSQFIQELREVKDKRAFLEAVVKDLGATEDYLEQQIITKLRAEGLDKASTEHGTASIKHDIYPQIDDFDVALADMVRRGLLSRLLKKGVKATAWRELLEEGVALHGVSSFEKDTLNFRRK